MHWQGSKITISLVSRQVDVLRQPISGASHTNASAELLSYFILNSPVTLTALCTVKCGLNFKAVYKTYRYCCTPMAFTLIYHLLWGCKAGEDGLPTLNKQNSLNVDRNLFDNIE